jgi:hypothetical protein
MYRFGFAHGFLGYGSRLGYGFLCVRGSLVRGKLPARWFRRMLRARSRPLGRSLLGRLLADWPLLGGSRMSRARCRTPFYRLWLRLRRRGPRIPAISNRCAIGRSATGRTLARRTVGSRVAAGFGRLSRWRRLRLFPGAQQRAKREQDTAQNQNASVSRGITHRTTCGSSGGKKPVVILHHPQRRHKLQRPADHPAVIVVVTTTFLPAITGSQGIFVNVLSDRHPLLCTDHRPFFTPGTSTRY